MVLNVMGSNPIGHPKKEVARLPFLRHMGGVSKAHAMGSEGSARAWPAAAS